jgi:nucleoside-diphosphate-sugar epimerase
VSGFQSQAIAYPTDSVECEHIHNKTMEGFVLYQSAHESPLFYWTCYFLEQKNSLSDKLLAQKIIRMLDRPVKIELAFERVRPELSEVLRLLSDNSLALQQLGWHPEFTLDHGLEQTIAWIRNHLDLYRIGTYEF